MGPDAFVLLLTVALGLIVRASAQTIAQCPANPIQVTYDDGSVYEICPRTNFDGTTMSSVSGTLSTWDCLQQCNLVPTCTRSVYRASDNTCLLKANTTVWITDDTFDSVHLVKVIPQVPSTNSGLGQWSSVLITPVIPVGAYIIPEYPVSTRVLMFSSWGPDDFTTGNPTGITQFAEYNFATGNMSHRTITDTNHDMFCPGMSYLQDGRLMITGGSNAEVTSFYDPSMDNFVRGPNMQIPRGYHSTTTTSRAQVFTIGGSFSGGTGGKDGELYDPAQNTWTRLSGATVSSILTNDSGGAFRSDNHAWLYGWKQGSVFQAGPSKMQHWFSTDGDGNVTEAGLRDPTNDAMCAVNVMYDAVAGKIFSAGGSESYSDSDAWSSAFVTTIGDPYQPASVQRVADLIHPRGLANCVVLPDGTVLITGGQRRSILFTDIDSWHTPELWDPVTGTTKELAPAAIPRNYHSTSILLSDGRVLTGGGGLCDTPVNMSDAACGRTTDHPDIEIFSPPYLFGSDNLPANRPVILNVSSSDDESGRVVAVGGKLTVTMNDANSYTFALVRMGSVTHSTNTDQRRVPILQVSQDGPTFTFQLPTDSGILLPGFYYVFALNQAGNPSIAPTLRVRL